MVILIKIYMKQIDQNHVTFFQLLTKAPRQDNQQLSYSITRQLFNCSSSRSEVELIRYWF